MGILDDYKEGFMPKKAQNVPGENYDENCGCDGGWIEFWNYYNEGGKTADICSVKDCPGTDGLEGGHVWKIDSKGKHSDDIFIIPLCPSCNNPNNTKPFSVKSGVEFVIADNDKTCNDEED